MGSVLDQRSAGQRSTVSRSIASAAWYWLLSTDRRVASAIDMVLTLIENMTPRRGRSGKYPRVTAWDERRMMATARRSASSASCQNLRCMSLSSGSRLGPYEVVARIGAGGMGDVYRA